MAAELNAAAHRESDVHPHCPDERADLFRAADGGSTEFEYLELLHALVRCLKPRLALETGTHHGLGTLAMACALKANECGTLVTIDVGGCEDAVKMAHRFQLSEVVRFEQSDSIRFLAGYDGPPFDFAFFDSDLAIRGREHSVLLQRGKLSRGAVCAFHDTSPLRHGVTCSWEYERYVHGLPGITFPLSRGLRLVQTP